VVIDGLIKTKIPQFRREQYLRTDAELLEFEKEFVEVCTEMAWRHQRVANGEDWKVVFYKNTKHCFGWYRPCQFYELCTHDTPMQRMAFKRRDPDYMDDPKTVKEGKQLRRGSSVRNRGGASSNRTPTMIVLPQV